MEEMDENVVVLPVLPLRGMMVFPYMMVHLDAGREQSISALEKAMLVEDKHVFLIWRTRRCLICTAWARWLR